MAAKLRRMILWGVSLLVLLAAAAWLVLLKLGNNTGIVDFQANQPVLSNAEVSGAQPDEIAARLVEKWLHKFTTREVGWAARLQEYRVDRLDVSGDEDRRIVSVTLSVKPTRWSFDNWLAGSGGTVDNGWLHGKSTRFAMTRTGEGYQLRELGPGPI